MNVADLLAEHLDRAPLAPETSDLDDLLVAGRRGVLRRRLAIAVGTTAVAVVLGGGLWTLSAGGDSRADDDAPIAEVSSANAEPWTDEELVRFPEAGSFELNPDAEVLRSATVTAGGQTAEAFRLRLAGEDYFLVVQPDTGRQTASSVAAGSQGLTLEEWATEDIDRGSVLPGDADWVRFDDGAHLVPANGNVLIVDQRPDPGFGESFAAPGDRTAVVEVVHDDVTYFLAVREIGGRAEAVPYRADRAIRTLDDFLSYAQQQYATNDEGGSEGLR